MKNDIEVKEESKGFNKVNLDVEKKHTVKVILSFVLVFILIFAVFYSEKQRKAEDAEEAQKVAKKACKYLENFNARSFVKLYHDDILDYLDDEYEDYSDSYEEFLEEGLEDFEYYGIELKCSVDEEDFEDYDKDDLEDLAEELNDEFDIDPDTVTAARSYDVTLKEYDDGDVTKDKTEIVVAKIDDEWFLIEPR